MIFVNTSLDTAIERNNKRDRKLPSDIVKTYWNNVQSNIGKFQNLFGTKNFVVVDNNNAGEDVFNKVFKTVRKLANKKPNNYIAKQWIDNQLRMKKLAKG
jgi:thymidylate kinase